MLLFLIIIFWFFCSFASILLFNNSWNRKYNCNFYQDETIGWFGKFILLIHILFGPVSLLATLLTELTRK